MRQVLFFILAFAFTVGNQAYGFDLQAADCHQENSLSSYVSHCDENSEEIIQNNVESENKSSPDSAGHDHDCHCPSHMSGCCHPVGLFFKSTQHLLSPHLFAQIFFEKQSLIKQGPFLEGPFQPPRA